MVLPIFGFLPEFLFPAMPSAVGALLLLVGIVSIYALPFIYMKFFWRPVARGTARLFQSSAPGRPLRIVGALLLLVGFHFDLLSS